MKKCTFFIIMLFLCFITCRKENTQENLYYSSTLLSQVNSGDLAVHGLTYNSNYLIYESTEPFSYTKFSYDDQNILRKVEVAVSFNPFSCSMIPGQDRESDPRKAKISQFSEFEYDDGLRLIKKSNYFIGGGHPELSSYQTYDYLNNQIIKLSYFNPQGAINSYHEYKYDDRGNITKDDLFTHSPTMRLYQTIIYEFDNKNNPYQIFAVEGTPGKYTNRNNIISETTIYYNGTSESRNIRQNVYEYNNLDYPVKINTLDCRYGKVN